MAGPVKVRRSNRARSHTRKLPDYVRRRAFDDMDAWEMEEMRRHSAQDKTSAERARYDRIVRGVEEADAAGRANANPYAIARADLNRRRGEERIR